MKAFKILCSFAFLFITAAPLRLKPKAISFDSLKVSGKQKELHLIFVEYIFEPSFFPLYEKMLYSVMSK